MLLKKKIGSIIAGALVLAAVSASPAAAAGDIATTTIGQQPGITISNTFDHFGTQHVVTVTARFSNHAASSVRVDSFQLCYSGQTPVSWISPYTRNSGGDILMQGPYRQLNSGTCSTWAVDRVYTMQDDGEVVRVVSRVTIEGQQYELIAGYYR